MECYWRRFIDEHFKVFCCWNCFSLLLSFISLYLQKKKKGKSCYTIWLPLLCFSSTSSLYKIFRPAVGEALRWQYLLFIFSNFPQINNYLSLLASSCVSLLAWCLVGSFNFQGDATGRVKGQVPENFFFWEGSYWLEGWIWYFIQAGKQLRPRYLKEVRWTVFCSSFSPLSCFV